MTASYTARPLPGRHGVPTTDQPELPASRAGLLAESRGVLQLARLLGRSPRLARMPRGNGGPVVDIPGWRTPESSMAPLRGYLRWLGHDARGWGLGSNSGDVGSSAAHLTRVVRDVARSHGHPVDLIGWSLGGVVAREAARALGPRLVGQVITFGSPIIGGPAFTAATPPMSAERRRRWVDRSENNERQRPLAVPVTSIYSRRDAIVPWQASLDHHSADVMHIEVGSTHLSMGIDPDVWEIIARRLGDRP